MKPAVAASALKVQAALGPAYQVLEFDASTRTAAEAAAPIGCTVPHRSPSRSSSAPRLRDARRWSSRRASNRVEEAKVGALPGERIGRADADFFVRAKTGFAIGGVPPVGHSEPSPTLIEDALFAFEEIWAAAGTPNAVFRLTPADLLRLTGGIRASIAR